METEFVSFLFKAVGYLFLIVAITILVMVIMDARKRDKDVKRNRKYLDDLNRRKVREFRK